MKNHTNSFIPITFVTVFILTLCVGSPGQSPKSGAPRCDFRQRESEIPENLRDLPKFIRLPENPPALFDPNQGEFEIAGKKPVGFKDFSTIWFRTMDYDSKGRPVPVKKHGDIDAGGKHFELRKIFFNGKIWSFETAIVDGVSYKFTGKFAKKIARRYGAGDADNKALHGHLIKFVKGKKAAEADLFFIFMKLAMPESNLTFK